MNSKKTIFERVKEVLDIPNETDLSEGSLYKLLEKKRNEYHPEKATNGEEKEEFEEKCKEYNRLLKELGKFINQKPIRTSNELAFYEQNYAVIESKHENLLLQEKIDLLNKEIKTYKHQVSELEKEITRLQNDQIEKETKKLLELYKPKKINLYAIGLVALLGILFNILLQIEKIANLFAKYAPFLNEVSITYITLSLLIIFSGIILRKYLQEKTVDSWIKKVSLTSFQRKLCGTPSSGTLPDKESIYFRRVFNETKIVEILSDEFTPTSNAKNFYQKRILGLEKEVIMENLKNIIIYNLLNKDLIQVAGNVGFEKRFKIKDIND